MHNTLKENSALPETSALLKKLSTFVKPLSLVLQTVKACFTQETSASQTAKACFE